MRKLILKDNTRILAIDSGYTTGFCINGINAETTITGTKDFNQLKHDFGALGQAYNNFLSDIIYTYEPNVLSIERPFFRGKCSYTLNGLAFVTHMIAHNHGLQRFEFSPLAVKKELTGTTKANKEDIINRVKELGFKANNDHEADAIGVMLCTIKSLKLE